jgi:hypothetical protein
MSFEWWRASKKLPSAGTENAYYSKAPLNEADAGIYFCKAVNPYGQTISEKKLLSILGKLICVLSRPFLDHIRQIIKRVLV